MSRMKHLLRKLHIGGGLNDHERLAEARPVATPINSNPNSSGPSTEPAPAVGSSFAAMVGRVGAVDSPAGGDSGSGSGGGGGVGAGECLDFTFLEEEFQVQLALAISASDPDVREDPESAQIDAAKWISLGCSTPVADSQALVDILSLHYWSYNVVNYNEKVGDGFYDVYTASSNLLAQGKIPLLVDLQAISVSDDVDCEVILVNRILDLELRRLEKRAYAISIECPVSDHGLIFSGLIQKIADLVVDRMGGPVGDADEMARRWTTRRNELRSLMNTIVLPLGHLDFGLSRHRALLFKVLADRINLPCMLVKGSYYTGTDDGAVNLIKVEDGSEYIIDLMGAPGTLIPAEVPSSQLPNSFLNIRSLADASVMPTGLRMLNDGITETPPVSKVGNSRSDEASHEASDDARHLVEENQNEKCEHEFGKLLPSPQISCQSSSGTGGKASSAQKKKVKNVSKYVISAAKNPEFAQKLHAVLLESGASPPPDLFSDISPQDLDEDRLVKQTHLGDGKTAAGGIQRHRDSLLSQQGQSFIPISQGVCSNYSNIDNVQNHAAEGFVQNQSELSMISDTTNQGYLLVTNGSNEPIQINITNVATTPANPPRLYTGALREEQIHKPALPFGTNSCQISNDKRFFEDRIDIDLEKKPAVKIMEAVAGGLYIGHDGQSESLNPVLGEAAECEIQWEDLRIGERIGIGSYGEVYHADWKGTEVAVKKFLNQDFSGEALLQFKSEVDIMLRMRHPNVVLFMGAVTRPPHFSILTEFLPRGSLYRLLHRPNSQLDERRRMRMALDVAKGMNYLHTSHPTIVHRDLKSPNLLVDKNWVVKVCDFGLSRAKHHTFLSSKSTAGTPEWMAPEVLRNEPANEKCDVYSFGVILWELATARIPWKGLNPMQVVGAVGFQNRRLEIPDEVDLDVAQIIHDCWQREPNLRPSFSELMVSLRRLQRLVVEKTKSTN